MSTKSEGLASIQGKLPSVKRRVIETLEAWPGLGREDIAELLDARLATICGAVRPLIDAGELRAVGTYINPNTGRSVEKLYRVYRNLEEA